MKKSKMTYRAVVKSYLNDSVRRTRWYTTWAGAQLAGEKLSDCNTRSINVIVRRVK